MITTRKKAWEKLASIWLDPEEHLYYCFDYGLCDTLGVLEQDGHISIPTAEILRTEIKLAVRDTGSLNGYLDHQIYKVPRHDQLEAIRMRGMFCLFMMYADPNDMSESNKWWYLV